MKDKQYTRTTKNGHLVLSIKAENNTFYVDNIPLSGFLVWIYDSITSADLDELTEMFKTAGPEGAFRRINEIDAVKQKRRICLVDRTT